MKIFNSNHEYREYMTKYASHIMLDNWKTACEIRKPYVFDLHSGQIQQDTVSPIFFKSLLDNSQPYEKNSTKMEFLKSIQRYF